jgi:hypothetical protein
LRRQDFCRSGLPPFGDQNKDKVQNLSRVPHFPHERAECSQLAYFSTADRLICSIHNTQAAQLNMLETPERAAGAITQLPASSSPAPFSDDDTICDSSFDAGSDHFAFTPKRSGKLPRAWERKPSTPFAPRTETQKIWKRVPLQDKPTNGSVEIQAGGEANADTRGVKRLRLAALIAGNGKENYASTQWDKQADDAKRKVPKELKYTLQSTRDSLSPLRKDSTFEILNDPPPPTALELEANHVIRRLEEMQKAEELENTSTFESSLTTTGLEAGLLQPIPRTQTSENDEAEAACDVKDTAPEDDEATTPSTNGFFTDSIIFDDEYSESEIDEEPILEDVTLEAQSSEVHSSIEDSQSSVLAPEHAITTLSQDNKAHTVLPEHSERSPGSLEQPNLQSKTTQEAPVAVTDFITPEQFVSQITNTMPTPCNVETIAEPLDISDSVRRQLDVQVEPSSALPDEVHLRMEFTVSEDNQAETPVILETSLAPAEASSHAVTYPQEDSYQVLNDVTVTDTAQPDIMIFGGANDNLANQLFTPQAPVILRPDAPPSDDTAYLNDFLTRARAKKAAQAANSPEKMDSPAKNTRQALANLSTNPVSPSEAAQTGLKPEELLEDTVLDDQATSPCRRTSRPRFPKPVKSIAPAIPNTIPVRRSNGTEFIFLPRSEAMQVALDTRTNTQRNKGEAVAPVVRLETLSIGEMSPIKERKKSSKAKKMVKWDENLSQEQVEAVLENQAVILESQTEEQPKIPEKASSEAEKSEKREKNARKSVKRLGTVNGTPAPKKRVMTATALPVPTRTLRARTKA